MLSRRSPSSKVQNVGVLAGLRLIYLCFPFFLFSLFWASPFFPFLFLCLYVVIFVLPSFLFFISVSGSCLFFLFCLVLGSRCYFVVIFLLVVLFCFESSCLISVCFASCFLVFVALIFYNLLIFGYLSKNLSKFGNCKSPKNEECRRKDTGTRAASTGALTNSVFFLFCVSLNLAFLLKTL